jgi:hypothetical protein
MACCVSYIYRMNIDVGFMLTRGSFIHTMGINGKKIKQNQKKLTPLYPNIFFWQLFTIWWNIFQKEKSQILKKERNFAIYLNIGYKRILINFHSIKQNQKKLTPLYPNIFFWQLFTIWWNIFQKEKSQILKKERNFAIYLNIGYKRILINFPYVLKEF